MLSVDLRIRCVVRYHDVSGGISRRHRRKLERKLRDLVWPHRTARVARARPFRALPNGEFAHLFMVIMAMHNSETPMLPYWMNGMMRHRRSPCVHVPCTNRKTLNGNTTIQNRQSATHKLQVKQQGFCYRNGGGKCGMAFVQLSCSTLPDNECSGYVPNFRTL